MRWIIQTLILVAIVFFGATLLNRYVLSKDIVQGTSMQPTLQDGDRLYALRQKNVKRNDIVVLQAPDSPKELYIKRVIGMPGDTVAVKNEKLYINGEEQNQPYLDTDFMKSEIAEYAKRQGVAEGSIQFTRDFSIDTLASTKSAKVPDGEYFVMGDNRLVSHDGRDFGFIKKSSIEAVVVWRYWPLNKMKFF